MRAAAGAAAATRLLQVAAGNLAAGSSSLGLVAVAVHIVLPPPSACLFQQQPAASHLMSRTPGHMLSARCLSRHTRGPPHPAASSSPQAGIAPLEQPAHAPQHMPLPHAPQPQPTSTEVDESPSSGPQSSSTSSAAPGDPGPQPAGNTKHPSPDAVAGSETAASTNSNEQRPEQAQELPPPPAENPPRVHFESLSSLMEGMEVGNMNKAYKGLMSSFWVHLLPGSPLRRARNALKQHFNAAFYRLFGTFHHNVVTEMVCSEVDAEFDPDEFLAGVAQDAVPGLMAAFGANDEAALQPLAADTLLMELKQAHDVYRSTAGLQLKSVDAEVHSAWLRNLVVFGPRGIGMFAPSWLAEAGPGASAFWLVISVDVDVTLRSRFTDATGGGPEQAYLAQRFRRHLGAPSHGDAEVTVRRSGTWLFARGPLPPGQARRLYSPWRVLGWW